MRAAHADGPTEAVWVSWALHMSEWCATRAPFSLQRKQAAAGAPLSSSLSQEPTARKRASPCAQTSPLAHIVPASSCARYRLGLCLLTSACSIQSQGEPEGALTQSRASDRAQRTACHQNKPWQAWTRGGRKGATRFLASSWRRAPRAVSACFSEGSLPPTGQREMPPHAFGTFRWSGREGRKGGRGGWPRRNENWLARASDWQGS